MDNIKLSGCPMRLPNGTIFYQFVPWEHGNDLREWMPVRRLGVLMVKVGYTYEIGNSGELIVTKHVYNEDGNEHSRVICVYQAGRPTNMQTGIFDYNWDNDGGLYDDGKVDM